MDPIVIYNNNNSFNKLSSETKYKMARSYKSHKSRKKI